MGIAILEITDGTTTIKLIKPEGERGFHLADWDPAIAEPKDGGVWQSSPIGDGRQMVMRRWGNAIESLSLNVNGNTQDDVIGETQALRQLLENAREYWSPRSFIGPVWIKAQSSCETYPRYAYIYDYRTPNDDDPYGTGFSAPLASMTDWPLTLERGHWQAEEPGSSTAVAVGGVFQDYAYGADLLSNPGFETAGGGGVDVFGSWAENAGDGTITRLNVFFYLGAWCARLITGPTVNTYIYQDIVVVPGQLYQLVFFYRGTGAVANPRYQVHDLTHGADIIPITTYLIGTDILYHRYQTTFTPPAGCISVRIYMQCGSINGETIVFDDVHVMAMTLRNFGSAASATVCALSANKTSLAQITHIFNYDDSIATYSANLMGSALPYELLPNPIAASDIVYFGIDDLVHYTGPFTNLVFNLNLLAAGTLNAVIEYSTVAGWTAVDGTTLVNTTSAISVAETVVLSATAPTDIFSNPGFGYFNYLVGSTHARRTVNGVYGWWIRVRVVAIAAGAPRIQQISNDVYTRNRSGIPIAATQVPGDIPALALMEIFSADRLKDSIRLHISSWSAERGADFNPFINTTNFMQPDGISISFLGDIAEGAYVLSPAYNVAYYDDPVGTGSGLMDIRIDNPLCESYRGSFRVLMRCLLLTGTSMTVEITNVNSGLSVAIDRAPAELDTTGSTQVLDLGKITLPWVNTGGRELSYSQINIAITSTGGIPATAYFFDLVLLPVDENSLEVIYPYENPDTIDYGLVDSTRPKARVSALMVNKWSDHIVGAGTTLVTNPLQLRQSKQQAMHVVSLGWISGATTVEPELYDLYCCGVDRIARYLSLRGGH